MRPVVHSEGPSHSLIVPVRPAFQGLEFVERLTASVARGTCNVTLGGDLAHRGPRKGADGEGDRRFNGARDRCPALAAGQGGRR